jgi:hypothetical protein
MGRSYGKPKTCLCPNCGAINAGITKEVHGIRNRLVKLLS